MTIPGRESRRTADAVYKHLLGEIISGRLSPDERLSPAGIADDLDVSRTPVRESILRLESEGLVERIPYRGVVVSGIDYEVAAQTAAVRIHLEGLAVGLAVPKLTETTLAEMEATLDTLETLVDEELTAHRWNELNDRFHGLIYTAAGSPVLIRPLETLAAQASRIRMHFDVRHRSANADHRRLLSACRAGDPVAAAREAQEHILSAHLRMFPDSELDSGSLLGMVITLAGLRPDAARHRARADNPAVRADEPAVRADNPAVRADEPAVRADNPAVRADNPAVRADKPQGGQSDLR